MTPQVNIEIVDRAFAAFNERDGNALLDLVHDDMEFFPMTRALAGRPDAYRGPAGLEQYLEDVETVWAELEVMPRRYSVGEDHVVVYGRIKGRTRAGLVVDSPADWIWKLRDGKLSWGCVYTKRDAAIAMEAAGIKP